MTDTQLTDEAKQLAAAVAERMGPDYEDGFWRSCSGCYETSDGYNVNGYPHSLIFNCTIGSGCSECGGIGAVWDSTDYEEMARESLAEEARPTPNSMTQVVEALKPFAAMGRVMETRALVTFGKCVPDDEIVCESSGEAGLGILTMGHFRDAAALLPDAPGWGGQYKRLRPAIKAVLEDSGTQD